MADQPQENPAQSIYLLLNSIPKGKVVGYGKLAEYAGLPGYGRYVGKLLRDLPKDSTLPWHRVIRASGQIAFPLNSDQFARQQQLLEEEGIPVINGRVAMKTFQWTL